MEVIKRSMSVAAVLNRVDVEVRNDWPEVCDVKIYMYGDKVDLYLYRMDDLHGTPFYDDVFMFNEFVEKFLVELDTLELEKRYEDDQALKKGTIDKFCMNSASFAFSSKLTKERKVDLARWVNSLSEGEREMIRDLRQDARDLAMLFTAEDYWPGA